MAGKEEEIKIVEPAKKTWRVIAVCRMPRSATSLNAFTILLHALRVAVTGLRLPSKTADKSVDEEKGT
jgi:hypothetical protein